MTKIIGTILEKIPHDCFSDIELFNIFSGTPDRRYGLIKRAIASGELIHVRRGLYYLAQKFRRHSVNLFGMAQRIYGPSYISLESALSYHGWIPETVYATTASSFRRSRTFTTPLGIFYFSHVSSKPFLTLVERHTASGSFLMATPWKAIADYVTVHKKKWNGLHPLIHSLRIEEDQLKDVTVEELDSIVTACKNKWVLHFFEGVRKELNR